MKSVFFNLLLFVSIASLLSCNNRNTKKEVSPKRIFEERTNEDTTLVFMGVELGSRYDGVAAKVASKFPTDLYNEGEYFMGYFDEIEFKLDSDSFITQIQVIQDNPSRDEGIFENLSRVYVDALKVYKEWDDVLSNRVKDVVRGFNSKYGGFSFFEKFYSESCEGQYVRFDNDRIYTTSNDSASRFTYYYKIGNEASYYNYLNFSI